MKTGGKRRSEEGGTGEDLSNPNPDPMLDFISGAVLYHTRVAQLWNKNYPYYFSGSCATLLKEGGG